ncbi:hypothetical protein M8C21_010137, partial [Ambrosia artemisiifolia]
TVLQALKDSWQNTPPNWKENLDPCSGWDGITCKDSRIVSIILTSMGLSGNLSGDIGQLTELQTLDLSYNKFTGPLTPKIGNLKKLKKLHLVDCDFSGPLPETLGSLANLTSIRLDRNFLTGNVPSNINSLVYLSELLLSNNLLTGPVPDLSGLGSLNYLDLSNNTFDQSDVPSWFLTLESLTTLNMNSTSLVGQLPPALFRLPQLQNVDLSFNKLNGTLDIGSSQSSQLQQVNLQDNQIEDFRQRDQNNIAVICTSTRCDSQGQVPNPESCKCAYPYTGNLTFRAPSFSDFGNPAIFEALRNQMNDYFHGSEPAVDTVSLNNPRKLGGYLVITLHVFPFADNHRFNRNAIADVGFSLSNQTFKPNKTFGAYFFTAEKYDFTAGASRGKSTNTFVIIGSVVGGCVLVALLVLAGIYALRKKGPSEKMPHERNPFALWDEKNGSGAVPQLKGTKAFSFQELSKYTNNFSESNNIGTGGYGMVS